MNSTNGELICRTCLKVIHEKELFINTESVTKRGKVVDILETCVSEMNLDFNDVVVLCCNCFTMLKISYEFKLKCLFTEDKIFAYIHQHNLSIFDKINLSDVVMHTKGPNSKTQAAHTKSNAVTLRDIEKQHMRPDLYESNNEDVDVVGAINEPQHNRASKELENVFSLCNSIPSRQFCTQERKLNTTRNDGRNNFYQNVIMFDDASKSDEVNDTNNILNLAPENLNVGCGNMELSRRSDLRPDWDKNLENCSLNLQKDDNFESLFNSSLHSSNADDIFKILTECL